MRRPQRGLGYTPLHLSARPGGRFGWQPSTPRGQPAGNAQRERQCRNLCSRHSRPSIPGLTLRLIIAIRFYCRGRAPYRPRFFQGWSGQLARAPGPPMGFYDKAGFLTIPRLPALPVVLACSSRRSVASRESIKLIPIFTDLALAGVVFVDAPGAGWLRGGLGGGRAPIVLFNPITMVQQRDLGPGGRRRLFLHASRSASACCGIAAVARCLPSLPRLNQDQLGILGVLSASSSSAGRSRRRSGARSHARSDVHRVGLGGRRHLPAIHGPRLRGSPGAWPPQAS